MAGLSVEISDSAKVELIESSSQMDPEMRSNRTFTLKELRSFCDDVMYEIDRVQKYET